MTTLQFKRGTAARWTLVNPVLAAGEPGYETDTGKEKLGDGTTAWVSLPYQGATTPVPDATSTVKGLVQLAGALGGTAAAPTVAYTAVTGTPSLATVATSGAYTDLSARPSLGGAAALSVGTGVGTVAAGDDARITGAVASALVDAKGDILVGTADNTITRKAAGANGKVLSADSTQADGLLWADGVQLAASGQTPTQAPAAPAVAASVGTLAQAARADHVHPSYGLFAQFGTGSDGAITLDGTNTYSGILNKTGNVYTLVRPVHATNLTISAGVTLDPHGQLVYVSGTLTNNGAITGAIGSAAAATAGKISNTSASRYWTLGCPNGDPTAGTTANGTVPANVTDYGLGGKGGRGGIGTSGTPPDPDTNFNITSTDPAAWFARQPVAAFTGRATIQDNSNRSQGNKLVGGILPGGLAGSSGSGDGTNTGGGAGDGGMVIIISARITAGTGTITAGGGNGGTPATGNCGGGGGGGGGAVIVNTLDSSGWTGTLTAPGGTGGTGVGTGAAGTAGASGTTLLLVWT